MKSFFIAILFILKLNALIAQGWVTVTNNTPYFTFSSPGMPSVFDTVHVKLFSRSLDSTIAIQVQLVDSAYIERNNPYFMAALEQSDGDTLRAIFKLIILVSNGELTQVSDIVTDGKAGLEVGVKYSDMIAYDELHSFLRYYRFQNNFVVFSISGYEYNLNALLTAKQTFFNSINFD